MLSLSSSGLMYLWGFKVLLCRSGSGKTDHNSELLRGNCIHIIQKPPIKLSSRCIPKTGVGVQEEKLSRSLSVGFIRILSDHWRSPQTIQHSKHMLYRTAFQNEVVIFGANSNPTYSVDICIAVHCYVQKCDLMKELCGLWCRLRKIHSLRLSLVFCDIVNVTHACFIYISIAQMVQNLCVLEIVLHSIKEWLEYIFFFHISQYPLPWSVMGLSMGMIMLTPYWISPSSSVHSLMPSPLMHCTLLGLYIIASKSPEDCSYSVCRKIKPLIFVVV